MSQHQPSTYTRKATNRQQTQRPINRQTSGSMRPVTREQLSHHTQLTQRSWQRYDPHTTAWFEQAITRYGNTTYLAKVRQHAEQHDTCYFCFQCFSIYHLGDYEVSNDATQTFLYCATCAEKIRQRGTPITLIQTFEEPEDEEPEAEEEIEEEPEEEIIQETPTRSTRAISRPVHMQTYTTLRRASEPAQETIELPETRRKVTPYSRNVHTNRHRSERLRQPLHPLVFIGIGAVVVAALLLLITSVPAWYNAYRYGSPPITTTSAVVGHHDSMLHPSQFIAENNHGTILVIEMPGGDYTHMSVYNVGNTSDTTSPAFVKFYGTAPINMYVSVGDATFVLYNNGTTFKTH